MTTTLLRGALAAALLALAGPALAHTTLETQQAPVASTYKAVLRVGHGCEGAPTLKLRVRIPDGVISVKPMPKPGWEMETVKAPYDRTCDYYGTAMAEGVREIVWTGKLPDEHYDEFVFRAYLTDSLKPDAMLYFPVVQECGGGKADRWIEIPAEGKSADDYQYPAPGLKLLPAKATH
ncbi:YcnI family copper-binding membrane protein [Microvirga sp. G4-2]|uniref:YcnI family copper-binding membrane protein n=1 Tax=Microvirga sp. G4-2 TaxID=3434467 RepID=UPI0040439ACD